jgi:hypothetical protein
MKTTHFFLDASKSSERPEFEFGAPRHRSPTQRSHRPRFVAHGIIKSRPRIMFAFTFSISIILWLGILVAAILYWR